MADTVTFELYRLLVEEIREARRARRELSNVFTTLNLAGVGALGFLVRDGRAADGAPSFHPALLGWAAFALVLTCIIWRMSNSYYTRLLDVKFQILYEIESRLGLDVIQREWTGVKTKWPMKWFSLEKAMPFLFILGYATFLAYQISWQDVQSLVTAAIAPLRTAFE